MRLGTKLQQLGRVAQKAGRNMNMVDNIGKVATGKMDASKFIEKEVKRAVKRAGHKGVNKF